MKGELRICPQCRYDKAAFVVEMTDTWAWQSQIVSCLRCGYTCHFTHWKTPEEHAKREIQAQKLIEAIERGESPDTAIRRIYPDSEPEKGPS